MADLGGMPISEEGRSQLMKAESKFAMDELLDETNQTFERINEAIEKYREEPTEDNAVVQYIILVMMLDSLHTAVVQSVKRFQRRARISE
jgi:hypothetical protein